MLGALARRAYAPSAVEPRTPVQAQRLCQCLSARRAKPLHALPRQVQSAQATVGVQAARQAACTRGVNGVPAGRQEVKQAISMACDIASGLRS